MWGSLLTLILWIIVNVTQWKRGGGQHRIRKRNLYILTKKWPDRHKNLYYWYLLYRYSPDTQNFDVFFTSWMKSLIKMGKLNNWPKCWGGVSPLIIKDPYRLLFYRKLCYALIRVVTHLISDVLCSNKMTNINIQFLNKIQSQNKKSRKIQQMQLWVRCHTVITLLNHPLWLDHDLWPTFEKSILFINTAP